ncbi:O-antigen ligase family protein [Patescibacteria group bacterium]|nr:O-antigen ligase family protein [Patescibacteria group bacterium]
MKAAVALVRSKAVALVLGLIAIIIVLLPFHAFLTVWAASNFGHYTLFRLWKEFLVAFCGLVVIGWFFTDTNVRRGIFKTKLAWLTIAYAALDLLLALIDYQAHKVSLKAVAYGVLDDLRFLAFFIICWAAGIKSHALNRRWEKLILWPAAVVVAFGLLQMSVLPANVLSHFGYGPHTIMPFQTINNNPHYIRILSTLRGSDPLGAYLILPIAVLAVLLISYPKSWNWLKALFLIGAAAVLYGSYSRGAWIGAVLAVVLVAIIGVNKQILAKYKTPLTVVGVVILVLVIGAFAALGTSKRFQNIVFHTQSNSAAPVSSDAAHLSALKTSIKQVLNQPFGDGPGTSGPASVYNHDAPARITEDYFLEVGEESGWIGLILFVAINVYVGLMLWQRRRSPFALALLAAFIGLSFVNLLTLEWTDDTMTYIFWGLAGLCIAVTPEENQLKCLKAKKGRLANVALAKGKTS